MLLLAVVALLPVACGGASEAGRTGPETSTLPAVEGPPPAPESLIGTWTRIGTAGLIRFDESGEFRIARSPNDLVEAPFALGAYRQDGARIELSGGCSSVWVTGLTADDELNVVVLEAGCGLAEATAMTLARIDVP
jgi:hypothetical protein